MRCQLSSKAAIIVAWLLCVVIACAGQAPKLDAIHYSGRIIDDSTGKPIESALIRIIPSTQVGAWRSDSRGHFSFWTRLRNNNQIEIEHEGYKLVHLSPQFGAVSVVRMQSEKGDLSTSGLAAGLIALSPSIAPAVMSADSEPQLSGSGGHWSRWYRLGLPRAPEGYTIQKVDFWLTGDRACGLSAQCRELERTDRQILWEFRLRGHNEVGAPRKTKSTAHIRAVYRAR